MKMFILIISFFTITELYAIDCNSPSHPFIKFKASSIVLDETSIEQLDSLINFVSNESPRRVENIILSTNSCMWEYEKDPFIGVKRAQIIIDYFEEKGLKRRLFYILDQRLIDFDVREKTYIEMKMKVLNEDQVCDEFTGIEIYIK